MDTAASFCTPRRNVHSSIVPGERRIASESRRPHRMPEVTDAIQVSMHQNGYRRALVLPGQRQRALAAAIVGDRVVQILNQRRGCRHRHLCPAQILRAVVGKPHSPSSCSQSASSGRDRRCRRTACRCRRERSGRRWSGRRRSSGWWRHSRPRARPDTASIVADQAVLGEDWPSRPFTRGEL